MAQPPGPASVVRRFVDRINAHDVDGIVALLAPDHRFVDSLGTVFEAPEMLRTGWAGYFRMVPDYAIEPERVLVAGNDVIILGQARGTYTHDGMLRGEDAWRAPGAWVARVADGLIQEWRVYVDNEPIRQRMRQRTGLRGLETRGASGEARNLHATGE